MDSGSAGHWPFRLLVQSALEMFLSGARERKGMSIDCSRICCAVLHHTLEIGPRRNYHHRFMIHARSAVFFLLRCGTSIPASGVLALPISLRKPAPGGLSRTQPITRAGSITEHHSAKDGYEQSNGGGDDPAAKHGNPDPVE